MKTIKFMGLLLVATMMTFTSCVKEDPINNNPSNTNNHVLKTGIEAIDPGNSFNPFDNFGKEHNEALESFINSGINLQLATKDDVYAFYNTSSETQEFLNQVQFQFQKDPSSYDDFLKSQIKNNPVIANYAFQIKKIIVNKSLDLKEKIEEIRAYENSFDYTAMSEEDATIAQLSSSVARYSLSFWAPIEMGGLGYGQSEYVPTGIDWWEVGVEDFLGACWSGFFTANPVVALAGGVASSAISALVD